LETGCAINEKPKLFTSEQKICANNPAQTNINSKYIHNGKGTAIIKKDYIKTQPTSKAFNNEKQVTTRLILKDINNNHH